MKNVCARYQCPPFYLLSSIYMPLPGAPLPWGEHTGHHRLHHQGSGSGRDDHSDLAIIKAPHEPDGSLPAVEATDGGMYFHHQAKINRTKKHLDRGLILASEARSS